MDKICICIAYNGKWTTDNKYLDHETKLILVNDEITFEGLVEKILQFIKLKRGEIEANIWFDTKLETSKGMRVTNDEEVTTCMYLLKNDSNFKTSCFIVDIPEGNSSRAKNIKPRLQLANSTFLTYPTKLEITEVMDQTSNDKNVRRSVRLSKKRKRSTIQSKKRKRSTRKREDLPTVILRDDASLDEIDVGSVFEDKRSLKKCFLDIARKHHFKFKVARSTRRRYYLKCSDDECSWCMHAGQVRDYALFKICKFENNHTCSGDDVLSEPRHITAKVISDYIIELVRDTKEEIKPGFVVEEVKKRYGMDISYNKAWRAQQLAYSVIGIPEQKLMIEESNPETFTDIEMDVVPTVVLGEDASLDEIAVGSIFEDKESLKKCFANNAIKHNFKFKVDRSNQRRYNLKCYDDECSWYLHSSKVRDSSLFRINKFDKTHICSVDLSSDQKHVTYKVISDYIIELLHDTGEEITPKFVVEEMRTRYGLNISYNKAWRAIQLAFGVTKESPEEIADPELCPSCLHLTEKGESNLETCGDIERDDLAQTPVV